MVQSYRQNSLHGKLRSALYGKVDENSEEAAAASAAGFLLDVYPLPFSVDHKLLQFLLVLILKFNENIHYHQFIISDKVNNV